MAYRILCLIVAAFAVCTMGLSISGDYPSMFGSRIVDGVSSALLAAIMGYCAFKGENVIFGDDIDDAESNIFKNEK